jgi:hypothetical protein
MQAESYIYKGQTAHLFWLAQKLATPTITEQEATEIIEAVRKTNPTRADQLIEFRNKKLEARHT